MNRIHLIAMAGVSALAIAAPAYAAEVDEEGASANEIIVQARRKDESLQDVPLVVQAATGEQLERLEIRRFEDVTKLVPGLQLASRSDGVGGTAALRGINFDSQASGSATSVEFYRNDAVISSGALFQAMYDIGQVEVLRGPQGTLRGRASPSGSITVTTKRPDLDEVGGYFSGVVGENSRWNGNAAINVPIVAGKLGIRVAGLVAENRGNNVTGLNLVTGTKDEDIFSRGQALRASLRADPFDGVLLLDFNYETIKSSARQYDQVESFNQVLSTAAASPTTITSQDYLGVGAIARSIEQRFQIYNWQAQLNLLGQKLTYVGSRLSTKIDSDASQDAAGLFGTVMPSNASGNAFVQFTDNSLKQDTHELRLQNEERILGMFDYVVGGMRIKANGPTLFNRVTGVGTGATFPGTLTAVAYSGNYRFRSDQEDSLFGNITAHITDRFEISGGLRRIWFKANSGLSAGAYPGDVTTYANQASLQRCFGYAAVAGCLPTKKATIYSASAKYNITDDIMAYVSYGTSWRPGNSVIGWRGAVVGTFINQFMNLPDEKSKSYEAGLKTSWLDDRLRMNVSVYKQEFTNYPFRLASGVLSLSNTTATATIVPAFNFVAPVPAKVTGFEADLAFQVSDNFSLAGTLAFANGKIANATFPCVDLDNNNVPDTTAPTAAALYAQTNGNQVDTCTGNASPSSQARWSGSMQAEYAMPVSDKATGYLRGFASWKGDSVGFEINPYDQVKAHALVDLFLGVRDPDGAWDVSLFAKNVFNVHRVLTRTDTPLSTVLSTGAFNTTRYLGITANDPREFGVNVRFAFGSR